MELSLLSLENLSKEKLIDYLNEYIKNDFSKVVQLLYRIDVSEAKLKKVLQENPNEDAASLIAELIIEKTKSKSKIVYKNLPQDDPKQRKPDIGKAKTLLSWNPVIDINDGLAETIKYFSSKI